MTTTIQISDKRADAILLVKTEGDFDTPVEVLEEHFAAAAGLVGLGQAYESFGAAAPATIPSITQLTRPQPQAQEPWGQPPVAPYQPQPQQYQQPQPQMPASAAPQCQHGTKLHKTGKGKNPPYRDWAAWFCPAPGTDPTQCPKDWIR